MLLKKAILEIKNVYTANAFHTPAGFFVGAGSETDPSTGIPIAVINRTTVMNSNPILSMD